MAMEATYENTKESLGEDYFNKFIDKDNITEGWILTGTPYPVLTILFVYLVFVLKAGPQLMNNKSPYVLKTLMRAYNIVQVLYNLYILVNTVKYEIFEAIINNSCTIDDNELAKKYKYTYLFYTWHYLILKLLDLLDTVFLVLRKKDGHITFLHVFHHVSMVVLTWFILTYVKAVHSIIPALINVFVHMIMYAYFFLATFRSCKKYLWWKHYLTKLQMGQFVVILLYISLLYYKGCQMSRVFTYMCLGVVSMIFLLFINFYRKTYGSREADKRVKSL